MHKSEQPRRPRTSSQTLEARLLTAAESILDQYGPEGLTVRSVAAAAGVAPMSVYNRFGSKDGLLHILLDRGFDRLGQAVAAGREADSLERLRGAGLRYREFALAQPRLFAAMFGTRPAHTPSTPTSVAESTFSELVTLVTIASNSGWLWPSSAYEVAHQIWSAVHGAVMLELQSRIATPDTELAYHLLLDTLLRGLSRRP